MVKNLTANAGDIRDADSISGLGRSPGEGHGNPLQYACLENPMDRGAWQVTGHGVSESETLQGLSACTHTLTLSHTHTHTPTHTATHTHTHTYTHTHTHTYPHTHPYTHTPTHQHTHTLTHPDDGRAPLQARCTALTANISESRKLHASCS